MRGTMPPATPPQARAGLDSPDRSQSTTKGHGGSPTTVQVDLSTVQHNERLPDLKDVEREIQLVVRRSAQSKASYKSKLGQLSNEVKEHNAVVQDLEAELRLATEQRDRHQSALDRIKNRREHESDTLQMRRLNLDIIKLILTMPNAKSRFAKGLPYDVSLDSSVTTDVKQKRRLEVVYQRLQESRKLTQSEDGDKVMEGEELCSEATDEFLQLKAM